MDKRIISMVLVVASVCTLLTGCGAEKLPVQVNSITADTAPLVEQSQEKKTAAEKSASTEYTFDLLAEDPTHYWLNFSCEKEALWWYTDQKDHELKLLDCITGEVFKDYDAAISRRNELGITDPEKDGRYRVTFNEDLNILCYYDNFSIPKKGYYETPFEMYNARGLGIKYLLPESILNQINPVQDFWYDKLTYLTDEHKDEAIWWYTDPKTTENRVLDCITGEWFYTYEELIARRNDLGLLNPEKDGCYHIEHTSQYGDCYFDELQPYGQTLYATPFEMYNARSETIKDLFAEEVWNQLNPLREYWDSTMRELSSEHAEEAVWWYVDPSTLNIRLLDCITGEQFISYDLLINKRNSLGIIYPEETGAYHVSRNPITDELEYYEEYTSEQKCYSTPLQMYIERGTKTKDILLEKDIWYQVKPLTYLWYTEIQCR